MAETVGRVEFLVGADGRMLRRELRSAAQRAGDAAGKEAATSFNKSFEKHFLANEGVMRKRLSGLTASLDRSGRSMQRVERRGNLLSRMFDRLGKKIGQFGKRADLNPRAIVGIILTLGESISSLASGFGASITAMLSSVGTAIGGLAVMIAPAIASLVAGLGLAINSMRFLKDEVPAVGSALEALSDTAEMSGRRFAEAWGPSVAGFLETLNEVLGDTAIIDAFAVAMSGITNAFTSVMESSAFTAFREQLTTNLPQGFEHLGVAASNLFSGLISLAAAAAPYFNALMESFNEWSAAWAERMAGLAGSSGFEDFMITATESLKTLLGFLDSVGELMGTVFLAGADSGNRLFATIENVFRGWTEWMNTIEGQNALEEWFRNGETIMTAVGDLLVDVGKMFTQVVTPESIGRLVEFLGRMGDMMPMIGEIITFFGELDILNVVAVALETIGSLIAPLIPYLHEFAAIFGTTLKEALVTLQPAFARIGEALTPLIPMLSELVLAVLPPLADMLVRIVEAIEPWIPLLVELVEAILPSFIQVLTLVFDYVGDFIVALLGAGSESKAFGDTIEIIGDVVRVTFEAIANIITVTVNIISAMMTFASGSLEMVARLLRGDFSGAFEMMEETVRAVFEQFGWDFDKAIQWVEDLWSNVSNFFGDIGRAIEGFGRTVANVFDGVIGWIRDTIGWFSSLFGAANNAVSAASGARGAGGTVRSFASGGVLTGPQRILAGEAGPEAIVPLRRNLNQVDPSVRALSAMAQGKDIPMASGGIVGGATVNVEPGAIQINAPDPWRAARETVSRIVEMASA